MPTHVQLQRLTDAAVAEAMAASAVPLSSEYLEELVSTVEVAAHLAEGAGQAVATVLAFTGGLRPAAGGGVRPVVQREARRQLGQAGPDLVVYLGAAADRDGVLCLLDRVRAQIEALPPGRVLGHAGAGLRAPCRRRSAALEVALAIVRGEERARRDGS